MDWQGACEETVPSHKGTCVERQRQDAKMKVQSEYVLQSFDAVSPVLALLARVDCL